MRTRTVDTSKLIFLPQIVNGTLTECRFYYADERKPDGTAIFKVDAEAHAKHYWELAEGKTQGPWMQTFVNGKGYTNFASQHASSI